MEWGRGVAGGCYVGFFFSDFAGFLFPCFWIVRLEVVAWGVFSSRFYDVVETNTMLIMLMYRQQSHILARARLGWSFVESEDWRKDAHCAWSGCGGMRRVCFPLSFVICFVVLTVECFSPCFFRVFFFICFPFV